MTDLPGLMIGGAFRHGEGEPDQVNDPNDGSEIVSLAGASRAQVDEAVAAADAAFPIWAAFTPKDRSLAMLKIADRLEGMQDEFAALEMRNCGKPLGTARAVERFSADGKRLKPREFASFDYAGENYTRLLWFFEGFTSYYDDLFVLRAGLIDAPRYLKLLATTITAGETPTPFPAGRA